MNKVLKDTYQQSDEEMSVVPVPVNKNVQDIMSKSMVPDPRWFDRDQAKFEDQQRGMRLFLKSNRVMETNNRITAILACLRESIVGIYVQRKLDKLDKKLEIQDWDKFVKKIKTTFSNKTKAADTNWKIESFKQEK